MPRRSGVIVLAALLTLAAWTSLAAAHTGRAPALSPARDTAPALVIPEAAWRAAAASPRATWYLVALALVTMVAMARRPRRALGLVIVICLAVFAFENGVHSVHHLNEDLARASCAVATASAHVAGIVGDLAPSESLTLPLSERVVVDHQPHAESRCHAVHQGRAPPLPA